jgi:phage-related baseplate assembly protein
MIDIKNLPEPIFVTIDWQKQVKELIAAYEELSNVPLSKGQIERLLLDIFAYRENLLRILMQDTAKQNLLAYARGDVLDHLGAFLGVERLKAAPAITTIRFNFSENLPMDMLIPKGTRVLSNDNKVTFATKEDVTAKAQSLYADVFAQCVEKGEIGNGYLPGAINQIIDPLPYIDNVENLSDTYGGADSENDERFRERIHIAPEKFSNAGSKGAYIYWAKTAHQDIVDVSITSPKPGSVLVYPILKGGKIPDANMVNLIKKTINEDKVRPLTDSVNVAYPLVVDYEIEIDIYLYTNSTVFMDVIKQKAQDAIDNYVIAKSEKLGSDIVPEQIISILQKISGVYRVVVHKPQYIELKENQIAIASSVKINIAGSNDG